MEKLDTSNDTIDDIDNKPNAVEDWKKAQADLQESVQKQEPTSPQWDNSRLKSLRKSTKGIETQVSIMNKDVEHWATLGGEVDV